MNKYLDILEHVASWSKDTSTKVGCAIINSNHEVMAIGCNNFPKHCNHTNLTWQKPMKYYFVVHAEMNALEALDRDEDLADVTLYTTDAPCDNCLKMAINRGIRRIEYGSSRLVQKNYSSEAKTAIKMLIEGSGISVVNYNNQKTYLEEI